MVSVDSQRGHGGVGVFLICEVTRRRGKANSGCTRPHGIAAVASQPLRVMGCYDLDAMKHDDEAEELQFRAFVEMTDKEARDQVAFAEFASMTHSAAQCAVSSTAADGSDRADREFEEMHRAIAELLFGLLGRIPLAAVLANADGIGYAIRYGVLQPHKGALDHVQTPEELEELADRGHAADQMEIDRRMDEVESKDR